MAKRKLDHAQQRDVALSHLCHVSQDYISDKWDVSEATVRGKIIGNYSHKWEDALVEFYREVSKEGNRYANAIHLYLVANGESKDMPNLYLIDKDRDGPVIEAVEEDIFKPRVSKIIEETQIDKILIPERSKKLTPEEILVRAIFGRTGEDERVNGFVMPIVYGRAREAYDEMSKRKIPKGGAKSSEGAINGLFYNVKQDIYGRLRDGLGALDDEVTGKVHEARKLFRKETLATRIDDVLNTLTYGEKETIKLRYGLGDGMRYTIEEVGKIFQDTRERVRQIEAKAISKMQHPNRANMLEGFLYDGMPSEKPKEEVTKESLLMTPINQFELSVRARNGLNRHNINTLYDLTRTYESQLLSDQRFGESSLDEVRQALYSKGLDFKGYSLEQDRKLLAPVSELGLSVRSSRIMERLDIRTIGDLRDKTEVDIMASRNSGMTTLNEIKRKLGDLGLSLREDKKRE